MKGSDSKVLAGRMVELDHNMKKDGVSRGLKERSEMDSLVDSGIQSTAEMGLKHSSSFCRSFDSCKCLCSGTKYEEGPGEISQKK